MTSDVAATMRTSEPARASCEKLPIREVEVIIKVAERCNLACSYCYYFFAGDQSFATRPARMAREVVAQTARFLADGARDLALPAIKLVFHGGEPLMLRKADFEWACQQFREALDPVTRLTLSVQTNGVLIDPDWVSLFSQYNVSVGISIDGEAEIHDRHRVDHRGRGSHDRVVRGIRLVHDAAEHAPQLAPGLLTVLDAGYDVKRLYEHFTHELGAKAISTLLPDCSHDDGIPGGHSAEDYGRMLCDLFDLWIEDDSIHVREVSKVLARFARFQAGMWTGRRNPVVVIQSDGSLAMDDSYVPAQDWRDKAAKGSVFADRMSSWLWNDDYMVLDREYGRIPSACGECVWRNVCGGGDLENRYSSERGFDNPSVYCEGLKLFYLHITKYLARSGYPVDEIFERLGV